MSSCDTIKRIDSIAAGKTAGVLEERKKDAIEIKHILFDLDGTLLPMKQDEFVEYYLPLLAKRFVSRGVEAKEFIGYICFYTVFTGIRRIIRTAKEKGIQVYLATNPVFPRVSTMSRIHWAGLDPEECLMVGNDAEEEETPRWLGARFLCVYSYLKE